MASFEDLGDSVVPGTPKLATPHAASPPQPAADAFAIEPAPPSGIPEAAAAALASQEGADRTAVDFAQFTSEEPEMATDTEEGLLFSPTTRIGYLIKSDFLVYPTTFLGHKICSVIRKIHNGPCTSPKKCSHVQVYSS